MFMEQYELLNAIATLSPYQKRKLEMYVIDALNLNESDKNCKPDHCPYCKKNSKMIKKGFKRGKQRYKCKACNHVFTYNSHTITMYSKIERTVFHKIVLDTLSCISIKATAAELNVSIPCVFENRHKILFALEEILQFEDAKLFGTIEFDETYELESQKGSRNIKRKARKRGGPSKYRGLSHEQVCIVTTTDRNGHEIFKTVGYGKPTTNSILENFAGKLVPKSIIYTDGAFCYDELVKKSECSLVQLKSKKSYNIVEHINTVNCIHSLIKAQLASYRGVATKYINRYMSLFVFLRRFQAMDDNEKLLLILRKFKTLQFSVPINNLKNKNLICI